VKSVKRWVWLLALAVILGRWWPFSKTDPGELYIIETLAVEPGQGRVTVRTEELSAQGADLAAALAELEEIAPGQLYLGQTQRVIFCGGPWELPAEIPMGAWVYGTQAAAESLDLQALTPVLQAREKRQPDTTQVAEMKNAALTGQAFWPTALGLEEIYGTAE
jgi:hypothetical protein